MKRSSPLWNIGEYAFIDCTSLKKIELNPALNNIGIGAFSGTTELKEINLKDSKITVIRQYTFSRSGITQVGIPDTCTKLDNYCFAQCKSLSRITIPDNVTEISDNAFDGHDDSLVIICNSNSYAASYAQSKGIKYIILDSPLIGDANADGIISINDTTIIQKYNVGIISSLTEYGMMCADVNHDGNVNTRDATLIQMRVANVITSFD